MSTPNTQYFNLISLVLFAFVALTALPIFIMEPDAALYAEISRELLDQPWYKLTYDGSEFLDKPHLPFWLSALSMKLLGVSNLSYKLPALICSLLSVMYTYLSAHVMFGRKIAITSSVVLISSFHFVQNINDVRAEPFIMLGIIGAFYYVLVSVNNTNLLSRKSVFYLTMAGCMLSIAFMSKGPFTVIPLGSIFIYYAFKEKAFWRYFKAGLFVTLIMMLCSLPLLVAYYFQFDSRKGTPILLYAQGIEDNVSALKFFFWDSQLGRFFNDGPIQSNDNHSIFHYLTTMIWSFFPWAIVLFSRVYANVIGIKNANSYEILILLTIFPLFTIFSLSQFQLPHYIVPLFPFCAMLVANCFRGKINYWIIDLSIIVFIVAWLVTWLSIILIDDFNLLVVILAFMLSLVLFVMFMYFRFIQNTTTLKYRQQTMFKIFVVGSLLAYIGINVLFYSRLYNFQASNTISEYIVSNNLADTDIYQYNAGRLSVEYQLNKTVPRLESLEKLRSQSAMVISGSSSVKELLNTFPGSTVRETFYDFPVTKIRLDFLNPLTRKETLKTLYLVEIKAQS